MLAIIFCDFFTLEKCKIIGRYNKKKLRDKNVSLH